MSHNFTKQDTYATNHSLDRFQEHYLNAGHSLLFRKLNESEELSSDLALTLLGRSGMAFDDGYEKSRYFLPPERLGLIVLVRGIRFGWVVKTYIRFGVEARDVVSTWERK